MARINVEDSWWADPRRSRLVKRLGDEDRADGRALRMWRLAQEFWKENRGLVPREIFETLEDFEHLLDSKLADVRGDFVYVRGSNQHLDWLFEEKDKRRRGGQTSASRPRNEKGQLLPRSNPSEVQVNTSKDPGEPSNAQVSYSYSPSSSDSNSEELNTFAQTAPVERPRPPEHTFAAFWNRYPRKQGKSKALKAYAREIKAGAIPEDLLASVERYRRHCEASKTEAQYIKHGPTFIAEWRDWLDPETGQAEDFSKASTKRAAEIDANIARLFEPEPELG
jgi:hypothetical protein